MALLIAASGSSVATVSAAKTSVLTAQSVSMINGRSKTGSAQKISVSGATNAGATSNVLKASLSYVGYNQRGTVSSAADINPSNREMPSIMVKVHLTKGFKYSVTSTLSYLRFAKAPELSLSAKGPSDSKAAPLNVINGSLVAKETGDYVFTWSLSNGGRFDGLFIANFEGQAPNLPNKTGSPVVDAMLQKQDAWWHDVGSSPSVGKVRVMPGLLALASGSSKTHLSYSFINANTIPTEVLKNDFPSTGQAKNFSEMTENARLAVKAALSYISAVTNLTFSEATDGSGNLQFGQYDMAWESGGQFGLDGASNLPGSYPTADKVYSFLNSSPGANLGDFAQGTRGWSDVFHEIGHALGLKHTGNYDASGANSDGPYLPAVTDNQQYTVMSYKDNANSLGVNASSYMLYDIAALQYLYGVNSSGSTAEVNSDGLGGRFTFSSSDKVLRTLYSVTGQDAIDLQGMNKDNVINLNAGTYSSIGILSPDRRSNEHYSGNKNVAIAYGSKINKVVLSTNDSKDTVVLNAAFKDGFFDQIENLQSSDKISLSRAIYGALATKNIDLGSSDLARTKDSRIVVNQTTGDIFYDADGSGIRSKAVKIASYRAVAGSTISAGNFSFSA